MVEIRVPNSLRTIQIFTVRQDILDLERCQEIDAGFSIVSSCGYCHTYWQFAIDKDRPRGSRDFQCLVCNECMRGNRPALTYFLTFSGNFGMMNSRRSWFSSIEKPYITVTFTADLGRMR